MSLTPKTRKRAAAAKCVKRSDRSAGTAWPITAESTVMTTRAEKAAEKTSSRGCRMAMRAATRNVLSPISENIIMVKARIKEWKGCTTPASASPPGVKEGVLDDEEVSKGSLLETEFGTGRGLS